QQIERAQQIALAPTIIDEAIRRLFAEECTFIAPNAGSDLRGILRKVVHTCSPAEGSAPRSVHHSGTGILPLAMPPASLSNSFAKRNPSSRSQTPSISAVRHV